MTSTLDAREQAPALPPPSGAVLQYLGSLTGVTDLAERSVLDIGCGEGRNSIAMAEKGFGEVLGIDADPEIIAVATDFKLQRGLGSDACRFVEMNAGDIEHMQNKYSVVMCNEVLHMMARDDQARLIENMRRLTRPGGVNIVSGYMLTTEVRNPQARDTMLHPGQLARMYEAAGWMPSLTRDVRRPVQVVDGQERVYSKSHLIARKPR